MVFVVVLLVAVAIAIVYIHTHTIRSHIQNSTRKTRKPDTTTVCNDIIHHGQQIEFGYPRFDVARTNITIKVTTIFSVPRLNAFFSLSILCFAFRLDVSLCFARNFVRSNIAILSLCLSMYICLVFIRLQMVSVLFGHFFLWSVCFFFMICTYGFRPDSDLPGFRYTHYRIFLKEETKKSNDIPTRKERIRDICYKFEEKASTWNGHFTNTNYESAMLSLWLVAHLCVSSFVR